MRKIHFGDEEERIEGERETEKERATGNRDRSGIENKVQNQNIEKYHFVMKSRISEIDNLKDWEGIGNKFLDCH